MRFCKDCRYADMGEKKNSLCNHSASNVQRQLSLMTGEVESYGIESTCLFMRQVWGACGPEAYYFEPIGDDC